MQYRKALRRFARSLPAPRVTTDKSGKVYLARLLLEVNREKP